MCPSCQQSTFWQCSLMFGYASSLLWKVHDRNYMTQEKLGVWYLSMYSYLRCYYLLIWKYILSSDNQSLMVIFFGWIWQQILNKYWPFYLQGFIVWVFKQNCKKKVGRQKPSKRASGLSQWTVSGSSSRSSSLPINSLFGRLSMHVFCHILFGTLQWSACM